VGEDETGKQRDGDGEAGEREPPELQE